MQKKAVHYLKEHGKIDRKTYCEIGGVVRTLATKELSDMANNGIVELIGKRRGVHYILKR
ncbi:MAG: hypothetical protein M8350_08285 [Methanosarcinaceae archaeon]|nr:hypothetical protein [Methanosarcinaceae archaeon]